MYACAPGAPGFEPERMMLKRFSAGACALLFCFAAQAQCQPFGWRLVGDKLISITERMCVYEKNGARITIMVSGFCPMNPC